MSEIENIQNAKKFAQNSKSGQYRSQAAWWLVFKRELSELWFWGKAIYLIILYSIFLGVASFVFASNSELDLMPAKEMVYLTLSGAITVGLFIALIIGADSFSGERERSTLEALLLTPTNRTQMVVGKFLASISPWPVAMIICIPYVVLLSQGDEILGTALLWGGIIGTILSPAFTGFGMLVSIWSSSNRTSIFVSLTVYLLFLLPVQFPGGAQTGTMGRLLKQLDPLEGADHFLEKIIVNNRTVGELLPFIWSPILFAALVFLLLFVFAAPRLSLDGGIPIRRKRSHKRGLPGIFIIICFLVSLGTPFRVKAQTGQFQSENLTISLDTEYRETFTGDKIEFTTVVTNNSTNPSTALILAMNIINLDANGDVVDPEDWSPERTQYLESLASGESSTRTWIVTPIFEGDYLIYIVVIPTPESQEATSQPISSSGLHLTINAGTGLNPGGVLPLLIGIPVVLITILLVLLWYRRKQTETSES